MSTSGVPATALAGLGRVTMSPLTEGFWHAAAEGRLVTQRCRDCGVRRHPPTAACANCQSQQWDWSDVVGRGTVFSYVWVDSAIDPAFAAVVPYNVCLVDVEAEGAPVRMYGNVISVDRDSLQIGLAVESQFLELDGGVMLPVFRSSAEQGRAVGRHGSHAEQAPDRP